MLRQIGADLRGVSRVRRVPQQRLAQRLVRLPVLRIALQVPPPLLACLRVVGQNASQRNLVSRVVGILAHQRLQARDGVRPAVVGRRLRLVVHQRPLARRRGGAEDLAVDRHRRRILPCLGQLARLLQLRQLLLLRAHLLRAGGHRGARLGCPQPLQIAVGQRRVALLLGRARKSSQSVRIVRLRLQHLLPGLLRQVHAAASLKPIGLVQQRLRCGWRGLSCSRRGLRCGRRSLCRRWRGLCWGRGQAASWAEKPAYPAGKTALQPGRRTLPAPRRQVESQGPRAGLHAVSSSLSVRCPTPTGIKAGKNQDWYCGYS